MKVLNRSIHHNIQSSETQKQSHAKACAKISQKSVAFLNLLKWFFEKIRPKTFLKGKLDWIGSCVQFFHLNQEKSKLTWNKSNQYNSGF